MPNLTLNVFVEIRAYVVRAEIYSGQVIAHLIRPITTIVCIANPELAIVVVTPTLHGIVVEERTRVPVTHRDCRCRTTCAEIYSGQVIAHLTRPITAMVCIANPELAIPVAPPTLHGFVVEERTTI